MRSALAVCVVVALAGVGAVGCAKKAASSGEAIQHAKTLESAKAQADYLIGQANAFLSSKEYQEAIKTAQYVLANVDQQSQAAKKILEDAKAKLAGAAQGAANDAKKALGSLGN